MKEQTSLVPKRRFKEFHNTDAWEQRKVSEMTSETFGGGTPKTSEKDYWDGNIAWIQSSDLTEGNVLKATINKRISKVGLQNSATKLVPPNSIAIVTRVGVGKLVFIPFEYTTSQDFLSLSGLQSDPWFSVYALYKKLHNELNAVQGTSIKGITKDELLSKVLMIPTDIEEQTKIGRLFIQLDNLITVYQRKLEKTKALKSACLSEMFPTEGEREPKRRFAGFTDSWEQRELGEISDIRTGPFGSTLHAEDYVEEGTPIITTEHFKTGDLPEQKNGIPQVSAEDFLRLQSYVLKTDDIVFSRVGSVDINALVTPFQIGWLFSGRVLRVRTDNNVDSQYLHYELSTSRAKNDVIARAVGQTMPSINTEILKKTKVFIPTEIKEQQNIGQFFATFDNLITLHQRKLEKLQSIKKAYLNEMFV
jgi:type I restriction enzyme S subunit